MARQVSPLAHVDASAELGDDVVVEAGAWVGPGTVVGAGSVLQAGAVVGRGHVPGENAATVIGARCTIASGAVLYHDVVLGAGVRVWHGAVLLRHVRVGGGTSIGVNSCIVNDVVIGRGCSIHGQCQVGDFSRIGDQVFIGPGFLSVSDIALSFARPQIRPDFRGVDIGDHARIGARVLAYPDSKVGRETVVGAGSAIRGELLPRVLYLGDPIRAVRKVRPEELLAAD
jgi:UDP-3-O-[3-hydroxymyristoyl] glucosamine N-acyltransferase